jgi:hypothetical protein
LRFIYEPLPELEILGVAESEEHLGLAMSLADDLGQARRPDADLRQHALWASVCAPLVNVEPERSRFSTITERATL